MATCAFARRRAGRTLAARLRRRGGSRLSATAGAAAERAGLRGCLAAALLALDTDAGARCRTDALSLVGPGPVSQSGWTPLGVVPPRNRRGAGRGAQRARQ